MYFWGPKNQHVIVEVHYNKQGRKKQSCQIMLTVVFATPIDAATTVCVFPDLISLMISISCCRSNAQSFRLLLILLLIVIFLKKLNCQTL